MRISFAGILLLLAFVSGDSLNLHYEGKVRRRTYSLTIALETNLTLVYCRPNQEAYATCRRKEDSAELNSSDTISTRTRAAAGTFSMEDAVVIRTTSGRKRSVSGSAARNSSTSSWNINTIYRLDRCYYYSTHILRNLLLQNIPIYNLFNYTLSDLRRLTSKFQRWKVSRKMEKIEGSTSFWKRPVDPGP